MMRFRRWLRFYLKKNYPNLKSENSSSGKRKLATLYAFLGWNGLALLLYMLLQNKYPMTPEEKTAPALYYARLLQAKDPHVYNIQGLTVTDSFQITGTIPLDKDDVNEDDENSIKFKRIIDSKSNSNKESDGSNLV